MRGATDLAIVTADGDSALLAEIKITTDVAHVSEPKLHHKAQLPI